MRVPRLYIDQPLASGDALALDRRALDHLEVRDGEGFLRSVAEQDNPTRVCSAGCIFVVATAMHDASASVLDYHQAVDTSSQTCVTCAAVAFT